MFNYEKLVLLLFPLLLISSCKNNELGTHILDIKDNDINYHVNIDLNDYEINKEYENLDTHTYFNTSIPFQKLTLKPFSYHKEYSMIGKEKLSEKSINTLSTTLNLNKNYSSSSRLYNFKNKLNDIFNYNYTYTGLGYYPKSLEILDGPINGSVSIIEVANVYKVSFKTYLYDDSSTLINDTSDKYKFNIYFLKDIRIGYTINGQNFDEVLRINE